MCTADYETDDEVEHAVGDHPDGDDAACSSNCTRDAVSEECS
ncbi:hypothetical protein SAMN04488063_3238 [Halopelagius inordinatus]|uniref:Uncharacterized protein n=1 Tax=Halopelagius inordinatus TaxID=553467 RepID=A0A1I2VMY0_9EURY|nr:hypothetical protein SAMN04488063_3238 [Halopelagius inordinatus]